MEWVQVSLMIFVVNRFSVLSEPMMKLQAPISGPGFPKQFVTPRRSTTVSKIVVMNNDVLM